MQPIWQNFVQKHDFYRKNLVKSTVAIRFKLCYADNINGYADISATSGEARKKQTQQDHRADQKGENEYEYSRTL